MVLVVPICAVALVVGWLRGGRLGNLAHVTLRSSWMVLAGFAAQLLLAWLTARADPAGVAGLPLLVLSQVLLLGFLWRNRLLTGMPLVLAGFLLNAVVIIANGAMPVAPAALEAVSGRPAALVPGKHQLLGADDALPWLADVLPIPLLRTVVSVGDVVLAAGVGVLVVDLMRHRPPGTRRRSRSRSARRQGPGLAAPPPG